MEVNEERAKDLGFSQEEIRRAKLSVKMQDNYNKMVRKGVDFDGN